MSEPFDLGPSDVARLLGVTKETVREWADRGFLPVWRTPTGHRRFRRSDVEALLAGREEAS